MVVAGYVKAPEPFNARQLMDDGIDKHKKPIVRQTYKPRQTLPISPTLNGAKVASFIEQNKGKSPSEMKKYVGYKEGYDRVFNSENADKMKEGGKAGKKTVHRQV